MTYILWNENKKPQERRVRLLHTVTAFKFLRVSVRFIRATKRTICVHVVGEARRGKIASPQTHARWRSTATEARCILGSGADRKCESPATATFIHFR